VRLSNFNPDVLAVGMNPAAMIETLVPASACAQLFDDVSESTMFPAEAAVVAHAIPERRREFATVRYCARQALRRIGLPAVSIVPDADGAPQWPAGVVGSMTHCARYRAAVVAPSDRLRGIGIDAEPHAALPYPACELVLRGEERTRLRTLVEADPDLHWDCILFCAKEAVFKACFPSTRRWLDFADISVTLRAGGTFQARLLVSEPGIASVLGGRWVVDRGLVVAATSVTS
jgi:4'-phosphopantetheinyl transferase EntD